MNLKGWTLGTALAVTCAAATSLVGCDKMGGQKNGKSGEGSGGMSAPQPPQTGTIQIGHFASMTGPESTFGVSTDNGIRLALDEINAAGGIGGRKVGLITHDTKSQASEGGLTVTRLITSDKVTAILGEVSSSISMAGGAVAQKMGVPMISPSSTNLKVTQIGEMISRVCFTDDFQAYVVATFLRNDLKLDKVGVLFDQAQAYSKGFADDFKKSFTEMGGTIVSSEAYTSGDPDVSAQLNNIKTSGAQAVFLPGYYTDAGNYMRQAKKVGLTVPFIGGDGWDSAKLVEIAGDAIEGSYYSNHYSTEEDRPEVKAFVDTYKAKFGAAPDGLAALGYDAARVLFDAMKRSPTLQGGDLAKAIAATRDFKGVTGIITIDANRNAQKKAVVLKIEGGRPRLVASVWPKGMTPPTPPPADTAPATAPAAATPAPAAQAPGASIEMGIKGVGTGGGGQGTGYGVGTGTKSRTGGGSGDGANPCEGGE